MGGTVEIVVVLVVVLLLAAGGAGLVVARGGWSSVPALTGRGRQTLRRLPDARPRPALDPSPLPAGDGAPEGDGTPPAAADGDGLPRDLARLRDALKTDFAAAGRADLHDALVAQAERLVRLEERVGAESERLAAALAALATDTRALHGEADLRQRATDARQDAALDRLRADLLAALVERERSAAGAGGTAAREWVGQRRAEVAADLYARLARLEAAVAAVTNPILLPGEPYAPPADFLPDALAWENWKDVGERAFAFADAYSAHRLFLDQGAQEDLAAFVTTLRGLLTQAIYPNLRPDPTPAQAAALRDALVTLAAAIPRVRTLLEAACRPFATSIDGPSPGAERP